MTKVLFVTIEFDNGSTAKMEFSAIHEPLEQSGTTYEGNVPVVVGRIEDAISAAVTENGLWPDEEPQPRYIEVATGVWVPEDSLAEVIRSPDEGLQS